jgi:hypothetical protein
VIEFPLGSEMELEPDVGLALFSGGVIVRPEGVKT